MSPQRRTALVSIVAACVLIAVKLLAGIATNSLGLLSEAAHSGTDLIAASSRPLMKIIGHFRPSAHN